MWLQVQSLSGLGAYETFHWVSCGKREETERPRESTKLGLSVSDPVQSASWRGDVSPAEKLTMAERFPSNAGGGGRFSEEHIKMPHEKESNQNSKDTGPS